MPTLCKWDHIASNILPCQRYIHVTVKDGAEVQQFWRRSFDYILIAVFQVPSVLFLHLFQKRTSELCGELIQVCMDQTQEQQSQRTQENKRHRLKTSVN